MLTTHPGEHPEPTPSPEERPLSPEQKLLEAPGLDYWSVDAADILERAESRVAELEATLPEGERLPAWARAIQEKGIDMLLQSEQVTPALHAKTERLLNVSEVTESTRDEISLWYRQLGPTNDAKDLTPFLVTMASKLETLPPEPETSRLIANLVHDAALRTDNGAHKTALLRYAIRYYNEAEQPGIYDAEGRAALRQRLDCEHQLLRQELAGGEITSQDFYKQYEDLQLRSITNFIDAMDTQDSEVVTGEQLEWAAGIFLRHRYWSRETADEYDVRSALPREDKPIYPWGVAHLTTTPIWSSDMRVERADAETPLRVQFKVGDPPPYDPKYRMYLPTEVLIVQSQLKPAKLRELVTNALAAVKTTYDRERYPNMSMVDVDEQSLATVDKILDKIG